jgi:hypothetical protein
MNYEIEDYEFEPYKIYLDKKEAEKEYHRIINEEGINNTVIFNFRFAEFIMES